MYMSIPEECAGNKVNGGVIGRQLVTADGIHGINADIRKGEHQFVNKEKDAGREKDKRKHLIKVSTAGRERRPSFRY